MGMKKRLVLFSNFFILKSKALNAKTLLLLLFSILLLPACKKEACLSCVLEGRWTVAETYNQYIGEALDSEESYTYALVFNSDGTGTRNPSEEVIWTLSPKSDIVYISITDDNGLEKNYRFDVILSEEGRQSWLQVDVLVTNTGNTLRQERKWELTK